MVGPGIIIERDLGVAALDGVILATDVYRPDQEEPVPCLLQRVACDKSLPETIFGALDVSLAIQRGFAVVVQDCRGRFASEGVFEPFINEACDGAVAVEWAAGQPWCDGFVGMFGRSYAGLAQWATAELEPEGLRAVAPMFSGSKPERDWFQAGGAFEMGFTLLWALRDLAPDMLARQVAAGQSPPGALDDLSALIDSVERLYEDGLYEDGLYEDGVDDGKRLAALAPVAVDLFERRGEGASSLRGLGYPVPTLVIAGWFDIFLTGCLRAAERLAEMNWPHRLVVGPWAHGGALTGAFTERDFGTRASAGALGLSEMQLDWFDTWLRAPSGPPPQVSRAVLFAMGRDRWLDEESWPPADAQPWLLWADAESGRLVDERPWGLGGKTLGEIRRRPGDPLPTVGGQTFLPGLEVTANAGPRDQRRLLDRSDLVLLRTEPLKGDVEVVGWVVAEAGLHGAPEGQPLVARLLDLAPDGAATVICEGAGHVTAAGAGAVHFEVGATWYRFRAGHQLGLALSATSFPRFPDAIADGPVEVRGPLGGRPILSLSTVDRR